MTADFISRASLLRRTILCAMPLMFFAIVACDKDDDSALPDPTPSIENEKEEHGNSNQNESSSSIISVTFFANNGTEESHVENREVGRERSSWENTFTYDDHVFVEWNTAADGKGTAVSPSDVAGIDKSMTLYAQWKAIYFTVTFFANNGTDESHVEKWEVGKEHGSWENSFTYEKHVFAGWNTAADGSGTTYANSAVGEIAESQSLYAQWVKVGGSENGHDWIDLGLPSGTKWATCNVGADKLEDYGGYFAWGETETKLSYSVSNYKYCNGSTTSVTKYCSNTDFGNKEFTDDKIILDTEDDAAKANWGGKWRMPTVEEFEELIGSENCMWQWVRSDVKGFLVTSKVNGASIFLPPAGCADAMGLYLDGTRGYYLSSSLFTDYPINAQYMTFTGGGQNTSSNKRFYGYSVRPVLK